MTSTTSNSTISATNSTTNSANSTSNSACFEPRRENNTKPTVSQKSQYWCLCVPNYTEQEYNDIASLVEKQIADFVIIGKEICPTTQTPHFHAYIQFKTRKLTSQVWRLSIGYWATCKGDAKSNIAYCSKQGNYQTFGQPNTKANSKETPSGHKEDQEAAFKRRLEECKNAQTFACTYPKEYAQHCHGIQSIYQMMYAQQHKLKKEYPKFVIYIAGGTGCGKTRLARTIADLYTQGQEIPYRNTTGTLTYFDKFNHQKVAILDDIRKSSCAFTTLLDLLDRYPLDVQQKLNRGGVIWDPEVVILTAPRIPEEEFKCQKKVTTEDGRLKISTEIYEDVNQLVRRCNVIMEFQTPDFSLTPSLVYHKGEQAYLDFINKISPPVQQPTSEESLNLSMPRYPSDEE